MNFQWLRASFGSIRDRLKQNVALKFGRNQNKDVSILTEAHINLDQIHHARNNCEKKLKKMKFTIKDFLSKCHQICSFLQIWSHLLKKSLMKKFIFCAVIGWLSSFSLQESHKRTSKLMLTLIKYTL